jgi:hypothetical protein
MRGSFATGGAGFAMGEGLFPTENAGFPTFWVGVTCLFSMVREAAVLLSRLCSAGYGFRGFFERFLWTEPLDLVRLRAGIPRTG